MCTSPNKTQAQFMLVSARSCFPEFYRGLKATHIHRADLRDRRLVHLGDELVVDDVVGSVSEQVFVALLDHRHHDHEHL